MKKYIKKVWLNRASSPSTGSVVVFNGPIKWRSDREESKDSFIEIADCHNKVRLHRVYEDSEIDWIKKMKKLNLVLSNYIDHLEKVREVKVGTKTLKK